MQRQQERSQARPPTTIKVSGNESSWAVLPYVGIALAALAVRLAALGEWPLLESEARTALAAWRSVSGQRPTALTYVPLLYDAQVLAFALFRASDSAVRWLPALCGVLLAFLPWLGRDILGKKGALLAAALLAFSPTWVMFSRLAEGTILAATACAATFLALRHYLLEHSSRSLRWALVCLVLGLLSGPAILTPIVLTLLWGMLWWLQHRADEPALADARGRIEAIWRDVASSSNIAPAAVVLVLLGTALTTNLGGLGASIDLQGRWFADLRPAVSGLPWYHLLRNLAIYEHLTLALALVGLVWGVVRRDRLDLALAVWVAAALLLGTLLGHRHPSWLLDALLPLLVLAARAFQRLWDRLASEANWRDVVSLWLAFALGWFILVSLASYIHAGQPRFLTQTRIALGILIMGWAGYWFWAQRDAALRLAVGLLMLGMGILTVRATTAISYQTGRDPRESLLVEPTSPQVKDLAAFLHSYSSRQAGDPNVLDVAYEQALDPLVGWYLRDLANLRTVGLAELNPTNAALVARVHPEEQFPNGYAGQPFRLTVSWPQQDLTIRERLRWFIFRDPVGREASDDVRVWVKLER